MGQALGHYRTSLEINPDYPYGHFSMGLILLKIGMKSQGCDHLKEALDLHPDYQEARQVFEVCR